MSITTDTAIVVDNATDVAIGIPPMGEDEVQTLAAMDQ